MRAQAPDIGANLPRKESAIRVVKETWNKVGERGRVAIHISILGKSAPSFW